jgi:hypothetical protein
MDGAPPKKNHLVVGERQTTISAWQTQIFVRPNLCNKQA